MASLHPTRGKRLRATRSGGAAPWLERLFRVRTERRNHVLLPLLRTQEHETIVDYARDQRSRPLSGEEQSTK
jgi:hypothetical protein